MTFRDREKERLLPLKLEFWNSPASHPGTYDGNTYDLGAALFEHCLNVLYIRDLRRKIVDFAAHFWSYIGKRK